MQQAASDFQSSVNAELSKASGEVAKVESELNAAAASLDKPDQPAKPGPA